MLLLHEAARLLDQEVVADARGAARDARHAAEAAVEALDDRRTQCERASRRLLHQLDAAAWRVHLLAPEDVGGAGREAEAAVDAGACQLLRHASTPAGSRRSFSASRIRWAAAEGMPRTGCGTYAIPAEGRTTASSRVESTPSRSDGANASRPSAR